MSAESWEASGTEGTCKREVDTIVDNFFPDSRQAWRLFRQFQDPESFATEFGSPPHLNWRVTQQCGSVGQRAIKLRLSSCESGRPIVQCESLALFPGKPAAAPPPERSSGTAIAAFTSAPAPRMKRSPRATACISTQPGCGVRCPFCSTGQLGYRGNLRPEQIVEQVYWAGVVARQSGFRLRNVVFMGMGEPLHNLKAASAAIECLIHPRLFGLAPRHITVSTAGVPRAMLNLARRFPQVRIALSLHAATSDLRRYLVPRATGDLQLLRRTIQQLNRLQDDRPVWLELVLFAGLNDGREHADALVRFCEGLNVEVNLIPYNPAAGQEVFRPSPRSVREQFASRVRGAGIRTTIRTSFGASQKAACGQLTTHDAHPANTGKAGGTRIETL